MTTLTVKERQHLAREGAILEAARVLLTEHGYEKMSMDDLAHQVGIAKATLYQHFPSKEDVLIGVVVALMKEGESELSNAADEGLPALIRLERGLSRCLLARMKHSDWRVGTQPVLLKSHPLYQQQYSHLSDRIMALLEEACAQGDVNPALVLSVVAHTIICLFRLDFDMLRSLSSVTNEEAVNTLVALVINGLKPTEKRNS